MEKEHYENNVDKNLNTQTFYAKNNVDPTKDTEEKAVRFVNKVVQLGHMEEATGNFIKSETKDTKPGGLL